MWGRVSAWNVSSRDPSGARVVCAECDASRKPPKVSAELCEGPGALRSLRRMAAPTQ